MKKRTLTITASTVLFLALFATSLAICCDKSTETKECLSWSVGLLLVWAAGTAAITGIAANLKDAN